MKRGALNVTIPATWKAAEGFLTRFRNRFRTVWGLRDSFGTELLLREALNNAVLHGCRCDPKKRVCCRVRMDARRVIFSIRDEGCGFDWRAVHDREAEVAAESGRGLGIYRRYASRVWFNAAGNAIIVIKRL